MCCKICTEFFIIYRVSLDKIFIHPIANKIELTVYLMKFVMITGKLLNNGKRIFLCLSFLQYIIIIKTMKVCIINCLVSSMTEGSRSMKTALGTCFPFPVWVIIKVLCVGYNFQYYVIISSIMCGL